MNKALTGCTVLLAAFTMPVVWAQAPKAPDKVAECRNNNAKAHEEVTKMFADARKDRKIDSRELQQFDAAEKRIKTRQSRLSRDGLTLAECQQLGKEIAQEKATVAKMAASDRNKPSAQDEPKIADCRKNNEKAQSEIMQMFTDARKGGTIDPNESRKFDEMDKKLKSRQSRMSRDGLTLAECQQLSKEIAAERATVKKMAASKPEPQLAECRNNNAKAQQEVAKMFADARKDRKIDVGEARNFERMEERIKRRQSGLSRDGLTLAECRQIGKEIAEEKTAVAKMAASPRSK